MVSLLQTLDETAASTASNGDALKTLEPLLVYDAGGIDWARHPQGDEYMEKLADCVRVACTAQADTTQRGELLAWLLARRKVLGRTALCLSGGGSLAMYHCGVCRFLLEEGLMPEVISGVSGGSIIAGWLAIHTDEELLQHVFKPNLPVRHWPIRWFPPWWQELINFARLGSLVPTEEFEQVAVAYYGSWTFEEAFARTGRAVSIVISSNFSQQLPACVMLNHLTAPRVTIASAVATSCAAIGIMKPRGLVVKDPTTKELVPFDLLGKSFADGSFTAEVPKDYLRSFFGSTQFIVSQVNPHICPFLGSRGGVLHTLRSFIARDIQQRCRLLSEYHLLPSFFGRGMCNATTHFSQNFSESRTGVTVFPPDMSIGCIQAAVSNPTEEDMRNYLLGGQRMTWVKAREIRARMFLEVALTKEIERIKGGRHQAVPTADVPPRQLP